MTATTPINGGRGDDVASSWVTARTRSCGIQATAATPSRYRPAPTRSQFNGSNANEHFDISANGSRVRFFRDVGNVTMDVNGVEQINFTALAGPTRSRSTT